MQAQREYPPSLADCRDKFLVQAARAPPGARDPPADLFDGAKAKDVRQHKLRVVLVGPPKPPSPVPEGVEGGEEASPARSAFASGGDAGGAAAGLDALARERDRLRDALARAERDRAGVQARLDAATRGRGGARGGGFSVLAMLLVAVLAFGVGHLLAKRLA